MLENLSWRNVAVLIAGLAIASCLMAWGIIIATDRVTYTGFDRAGGAAKIQLLKVGTPAAD
jgi:hypothetical protein